MQKYISRRCAQSKLYPRCHTDRKAIFAITNFFPAIFETFKVLSFYIVYSVQWGNFHLLFCLTVFIMVSVRDVLFVHFFRVFWTLYICMYIDRTRMIKEGQAFPVFWNQLSQGPQQQNIQANSICYTERRKAKRKEEVSCVRIHLGWRISKFQRQKEVISSFDYFSSVHIILLLIQKISSIFLY